jgi:hypothetical protein
LRFGGPPDPPAPHRKALTRSPQEPAGARFESAAGHAKIKSQEEKEVDTHEVERLRKAYMEIVNGMDADEVRSAYYFGRLEIVTRQLFQLIDRDA